MQLIKMMLYSIVIIFLFICVSYLDERLDNQQSKNKDLQVQLNYVRTEFETYKKQDLEKQNEFEKQIKDCERDTKTFTDIVVNGRWQ